MGSENHIWVQLPPIANQHIFFCAIYNPPERSPYYDDLFFEKMEWEINTLACVNKNCSFILAGDFNARTGQLCDFVYHQDNNDLGLSERTIDIERYSIDTVINNNGKKLIELCRSANLKICNGRYAPKDDTGSFTFIAPTGQSVVDYIKASAYLIDNNVIPTFSLKRFI